MIITLVCVDKGGSPASGTDRYTANLIRVLLSANQDLVVFTHRNSRVQAFLGPKEIAGVRWRSYQPPRILDVGLAVVFWHLLVLPLRLRASSRDVVHITNGRPVLFRAVITLHDVAETAIAGKFDRWRLLYRRLLLYPVLRRHVPLLTVSETARSDIARELKLPDDLILVVPNIVFKSSPQETPPSESQGGSPYVLYVGRIDHPSKNLVTLIEAFELVAKELPTCRLLLAGMDSWGAELVHARADRSPVKGRIRFLGFVADQQLRELIQGATVVCQPSLHEGFGLPVVEAVTAGVPVLASDSGALPEILGDRTGCIPSDQPAAWARALRQVLTVPEERGRLLTRQRRGVGDRFEPSVALRSLMRIYSSAPD